jgi:hypothetical protein
LANQLLANGAAGAGHQYSFIRKKIIQKNNPILCCQQYFCDCLLIGLN